jgi:hypothetical protein
MYELLLQWKPVESKQDWVIGNYQFKVEAQTTGRTPVCLTDWEKNGYILLRRRQLQTCQILVGSPKVASTQYDEITQIRVSGKYLCMLYVILCLGVKTAYRSKRLTEKHGNYLQRRILMRARALLGAPSFRLDEEHEPCYRYVSLSNFTTIPTLTLVTFDRGKQQFQIRLS